MCFTLSNFPSAEVPGFLQELSRNHRYRGDFDTKATLRHGQMSQVYVVSQEIFTAGEISREVIWRGMGFQKL